MGRAAEPAPASFSRLAPVHLVAAEKPVRGRPPPTPPRSCPWPGKHRRARPCPGTQGAGGPVRAPQAGQAVSETPSHRGHRHGWHGGADGPAPAPRCSEAALGQQRAPNRGQSAGGGARLRSRFLGVPSHCGGIPTPATRRACQTGGEAERTQTGVRGGHSQQSDTQPHAPQAQRPLGWMTLIDRLPVGSAALPK